jgi:hypothetical protein
MASSEPFTILSDSSPNNSSMSCLEVTPYSLNPDIPLIFKLEKERYDIKKNLKNIFHFMIIFFQKNHFQTN